MNKIGFLGLGIMGTAMARNLLRAGYDLTVWNRTASRCDPLVAEGARAAASPAEVAETSPVIFAMVADPGASTELCFGRNGVLEAMGPWKAYVDFSTVDPATSRRIGEAVQTRGGRFLEAPVSGSRQPAEEGKLIILAAGDRSLYDELLPAFSPLSKKSVYLGETGKASAMKLTVNLVMAQMMVALSEGLALSGRAGLASDQVLEIFDAGVMANPLFRTKGPRMAAGDFAAAFPLKHAQKDLRLALALADELSQPLAGAAASNETFKRARALGLGEEDFSAVFRAVGCP